MLDPVINKFGITYDRKTISEWFEISNIDPFTNQKCDKKLADNVLVRNLILKSIDKQII